MLGGQEKVIFDVNCGPHRLFTLATTLLAELAAAEGAAVGEVKIR
jgi:hypothetical protein